jgi:hypothetical protein
VLVDAHARTETRPRQGPHRDYSAMTQVAIISGNGCIGALDLDARVVGKLDVDAVRQINALKDGFNLVIAVVATADYLE